ncbi:MAG: META domain-containing protein, partial [Bacteroidota bacterium]
LIVLSGFVSGCSDDDSQDIIEDQTVINILEEDWLLTSILVENESTSLTENDYPKEMSYVLRFTDDTNFDFDTSVNAARGTYMVDGDSIDFTGYQELTEIAPVDSKLVRVDEILVMEVNNITRYSINNEELILYWERGQLVFKKYDL